MIALAEAAAAAASIVFVFAKSNTNVLVKHMIVIKLYSGIIYNMSYNDNSNFLTLKF